MARGVVPAELVGAAAESTRARCGRLAGFPGRSIRDRNSWLASSEVHALTFAPWMRQLVRAATGWSSARIYHTEAIIKRPGDGAIYWHQDQLFCPVAEEMLALWIPLAPIRSGRLVYADRSHALGLLDAERLGASGPLSETHEIIETMICRHRLRTHTYDAGVGDVIVHRGLALHSSEPNTSTELREAFAVFLVPGESVLEVGMRATQYDQMMKYFPGLLPGDLAASPLNPLVY